MYNINIIPRTFHFKQPAKTSRGEYLVRKSWLIELTSDVKPDRKGIGECAPLPDLSCDYSTDYGVTLKDFCDKFVCGGRIPYEDMRDYPSMLFGLETAFRQLSGEHGVIYDTPFSRGEMGMPINGLVWMGTYEQMNERMEQKLRDGYRCIKLKVGAINFDDELELVKNIRRRFSDDYVELRLDANCGFTYDEALYKLELLSQYSIHSIEQPIKVRQWGRMAELCRDSPLPIALDEELIGVNDVEMKDYMLNVIKPAYIVIKPSLHGGIKGTEEWVAAARRQGIGSWVTSALESNIGLNAIAQLTAHLYGSDISLAQGLGTGQLFTDNIETDLEIRGDELWRKRV